MARFGIFGRRPVLDTGLGYFAISSSSAGAGYHWFQRSSQSGL